MRPEARFCKVCGTPARGVAPAAPRPARQGMSPQRAATVRSPGTSGVTITLGMVFAGGGLALAAVSTVLAWAKASSGGFSASVKPFDEGVRFRVADWLGTGIKLDGLAVLVVAMLGLTVLAMGLAGRTTPRKATSTAGIIGGLMLAFGMIQVQFVSSLPGPWGPGIGLYLLIGGGALAILSQFLPSKPLGG